MSTRFVVEGSTHDELINKATAVWNRVSGETKLPQWTKIDVTPSLDAQFGDGQQQVLSWQADVYVPAQPITPGSRYNDR